MSIHQTALVSPHAWLGRDVTIGPFAIVEENTKIGDRCVIETAAQIRNGTEIGADCFVGSGAIIGANPQFRGFNPELLSGVIAGERNVFREYVTIHRSIHEGINTILGDDNFLMVGTHVGHDSTLGDGNSIANNVLLGGHVSIGHNCFLGGASAIHQFVRIGDFVMCQGHSAFTLDVPPYVIGAEMNVVVGINSIGLKRAGFAEAERTEIKAAFRKIYHGSGTLQSVLAELNSQELSPATLKFYEFFGEVSKKGVCTRTSRRKAES